MSSTPPILINFLRLRNRTEHRCAKSGGDGDGLEQDGRADQKNQKPAPITPLAPPNFVQFFFVNIRERRHPLLTVLSIMRRCIQADANPSNQQVFNEGRYMTLFLEESPSRDFISEKLKGQINEIKEQLEKVSRCESLDSLLTEDVCKIKAILEQPRTKENAIALSRMFYHTSSTTSTYIESHKEKLSTEIYEALKLSSYNLKLIGKICEVAKLHIPELRPNDNLKNLKQWNEFLNLHAEFVDLNGCDDIRARFWLEKVANNITDITSEPYLNNPKKEKYRRSLRNSAGFIIQYVKKCEAHPLDNFAIGSIPSAKLLEETESRLHLLDLLTPSNDAEAKEQRETRQHLSKMFGD